MRRAELGRGVELPEVRGNVAGARVAATAVIRNRRPVRSSRCRRCFRSSRCWASSSRCLFRCRAWRSSSRFSRSRRLFARQSSPGDESESAGRWRPRPKVAAFFGSLMTAITIAVVVVVASVGTFCTICLASGKRRSDPGRLAGGGIVTMPILIALGKWVRNRYRRDTLSDRHPPGGPVE